MWAGGIIWGGLCPCFRWPCYSTDKNVLTDRHITTRLLTTCVAVPATIQDHVLPWWHTSESLSANKLHCGCTDSTRTTHAKTTKRWPRNSSYSANRARGGIGLGFKEMTAFTKTDRNVHVCITELHHFCTSKTFSTDFGLINIRDCDSDENSISCCLDIYRRGHNCGCYNISHIHTQTHTHVQNKMSQQSCKSLDTQSEVKKEIKASTLEGSRWDTHTRAHTKLPPDFNRGVCSAGVAQGQIQQRQEEIRNEKKEMPGK